MIETRFATARRDREIDARILKHPFRVVGFHDGRLRIKQCGIKPNRMAQILDGRGIAVRAGHHCTQPLLRRLGVPATNRASFYLYSLPEEVDRLADGLRHVYEVFA